MEGPRSSSLITKKFQSLFRRPENGDNMIFQGSEENYIKNGSLLLQERISLFHGKTNTIPCLSVHDLNTRFHHWVLYRQDGYWMLYNCFWEGRPVLAKIFKHRTSGKSLEQSCREIAVATQMGTHKNVHKLLACCLETRIPVLIYEYVQNLNLDDIYRANSIEIPLLEWKNKLRIAWEISHAIAYLHSAFPRPIIHRDLKPANVFLDQHNVAKLSDFSHCISIPDGETEVVLDRIIGTWFILDPEYMKTGTLTEKADLYAFGVLLFVLLTGTSPHIEWEKREEVNECFQHKHFCEFVDILSITKGVTDEGLRQQLEGCAQIVANCMAEKPDSRPSMEEVATQLKDIITSSESSHYNKTTLVMP